MNPDVVNERKEKLEKFLKHISLIPECLSSEHFGVFIDKQQLVKSENRKTFKSGSIRIKNSMLPILSGEEEFNYPVGTRLRAIKSVKSTSHEDISILKGDFATYRGESRGTKIKVEIRGTVGWVPMESVEVVPGFLIDPKVLDDDAIHEEFDKQIITSPLPSRKLKLQKANHVAHSPPKIGMYRSKSEENLPDIVSSETQHKVRNYLSFFEDYYKDFMKYLGQRKQRYEQLKENMDKVHSEEEKSRMLEKFKQHESGILRRRRRKIRLEDFEIVDMIGKGGFGKVYLARDSWTNEIVALKKIKKSTIVERNKVESIRTEREVLKGTESPWLVKLMCSFQDDRNLYLAMQYAPGGNLKGLLEHLVLQEKHAKFYIAEMILAVATLHELGFVHRDLKPDNFLFDKEGHIKLADFGLSKGGIVKKLDTQGTVNMKIFLADASFRTIAVNASNTIEDVMDMLTRKLVLADIREFAIYEVSLDNSKERRMNPVEKPFKIMESWHVSQKFVLKKNS